MDKPKTTLQYATILKLVAEGVLNIHHTAYFRGYVSRKQTVTDTVGYPYKGRFGTGYIVDLPTENSTRYCVRAYFIFNEKRGKRNV